MNRRAAVGRVLMYLMLMPPPLAWAQFRGGLPTTTPTLGIGVDTLSTGSWAERPSGPVASIYHRWADFLASTAPRYTAPGAAPSSFWSLKEQRRWITFPLALTFVSRSAVPLVLDIRPASSGSDSVYVVKTLFQTPAPGQGMLPSALTRVYAVRERGNWVFSNALPRTTRDWQHRTVGPFDYVYPVGYRFDAVRAQRAARFADSLAIAFGLPRISHVAYYLTDSSDEMNRIIGLDWYPATTDGGAFSSGPNRLLVSGNPAQGENYRHEIVHVVLSPIGSRGIHPLLWEGVATWLGGTLGMDPQATRRAYADYLRAHPDLTLDAILSETRDQGFRPAGALLCQMAYDRGGMSALKTLLDTARTDGELRFALQKLMHATWPEVEVAWRRTALK